MMTTSELAYEIEEYLEKQADNASPEDLHAFSLAAIQSNFPDADPKRLEKALKLLEENEDIKELTIYTEIYVPSDQAGDRLEKHLTRAGLVKTSPFYAYFLGIGLIFLLVYWLGDGMTAGERELRLETLVWAAFGGAVAGLAIHSLGNRVWAWRAELTEGGAAAVRGTVRAIVLSSAAVGLYTLVMIHYGEAIDLGHVIGIAGLVIAATFAHMAYAAQLGRRAKKEPEHRDMQDDQADSA